MARHHARNQGPADELGILIGQAISEGILEGLRDAVETAQKELAPLHAEVLSILRRDAESQIAAERAEAEELANIHRPCGDPGCGRQAVARGLCRRHYARLTYRERRERMGVTVEPRAEREPVPAAPNKRVAKKGVAAIAPIVRRKKELDEAGAERGDLAAPDNRTETSAVTAESVARFFGLGK